MTTQPPTSDKKPVQHRPFIRHPLVRQILDRNIERARRRRKAG